MNQSVPWACLHIKPLHTIHLPAVLNCFRNDIFLLSANCTSIISLIITILCCYQLYTRFVTSLSPQAAVLSRSPVLVQTLPLILLKEQSSFVCLTMPVTCCILSTAQYQVRHVTRKLNSRTDFMNYATNRSLQEQVRQALNTWDGLDLDTANYFL